MNAIKMESNFKYGFLIFIQSIIWGIGNPLTKIGLQSITPFYCLAFRFTIASVVFLIFFRKNLKTLLTQENWFPIFLVCASNASGFILGNVALKLTSATNVGFLSSLSVVFTPIVSFLILKTPIKIKQVFVIGSVTVGLYLLCSKAEGFVFNVGDLLALICAFAAGITLTLCSKQVAQIDVAALSTLQTIFVAIASWVFALCFEDFNVYRGVTPIGWGVIIYLALACSCVAYLFQNTALIHISASKVAMIQCSLPVFTAIASFFLLGEVLSFQGVIGAAFILCSIVIASVW